MTDIFIFAHSPLASAFCDCVVHIYGALPECIVAFDVLSNDDPKQSANQLRESITALLAEKHEVIILTDISGATPANIAVDAVRDIDVPVLAGLNLPMLLKGICYWELSKDVLLEKILNGATQGIVLINKNEVAK